MKKLIAIILIIVGFFGLVWASMPIPPPDNCCACPYSDSVTPGSGLVALLRNQSEKNTDCSKCELFGCSDISSTIPIDFIIISNVIELMGVLMLYRILKLKTDHKNTPKSLLTHGGIESQGIEKPKEE